MFIFINVNIFILSDAIKFYLTRNNRNNIKRNFIRLLIPVIINYKYQ